VEDGLWSRPGGQRAWLCSHLECPGLEFLSQSPHVPFVSVYGHDRKVMASCAYRTLPTQGHLCPPRTTSAASVGHSVAELSSGFLTFLDLCGSS
jgi:hypothetical protein